MNILNQPKRRILSFFGHLQDDPATDKDKAPVLVASDKNATSRWCCCKFGIVAAMSKNRIIGINGTLPWNLPSDRRFFVNLTKNKVLIIGRKTLLERPSLSHISHARATIVVSKTLFKKENNEFLDHPLVSRSATPMSHELARGTREPQQQQEKPSSPVIHVVESFPEALELAFRLSPACSPAGNNALSNAVVDSVDVVPSVITIEKIDCWVAGGEKLYQEALDHVNAQFFHLTVVDMIVDDVDKYSKDAIARFPPKYRWDHKFRLVVESTTTTAPLSPQQPKLEIIQPTEDFTYTRYCYQNVNRLRRHSRAG